MSPERTDLLRTGRGRTLGRVGPRGEEEPRAVDTTQTAQTLILVSGGQVPTSLLTSHSSFKVKNFTVSLKCEDFLLLSVFFIAVNLGLGEVLKDIFFIHIKHQSIFFCWSLLIIYFYRNIFIISRIS